jgi:hypothetical protein
MSDKSNAGKQRKPTANKRMSLTMKPNREAAMQDNSEITETPVEVEETGMTMQNLDEETIEILVLDKIETGG